MARSGAVEAASAESAPSLPRWKHKPYNREGKFHLSTINTGDRFTDEQTGVLESPRFVVNGDKASFLVSGGFDEKNLYVALCDATTGEVLRKAGGSKGPQMQRVTWSLKDCQGKPVFLRVVDKSEGGWGHLCFDDFSTEGELAK